MKIKLITLFVAILLFNTRCEQKPNAHDVTFNQEKLLQRVKELSSDKFEGRRTGEKGNDLARAYIVKELLQQGVKSFYPEYEQPFVFNRGNDTLVANNVLGLIKGTENPNAYIVISAHYDHLGIGENGEIYNGADDDASGVSALFSFVEHLRTNPPKHSVVLAAFDAEEMGLMGAKHFVSKVKDSTIIANINMDMISRSSKDELYVVGSRYNEKLSAIVNDFKNPTTSKLLVGHDGTDGKQDWTYASDHAPFHQEGIPFLYFGNEDHAAYHKPTDDFEEITPDFYKNAVAMIIAMFNDIDAKGL
ncbi:MAG: M28 family peptidase [Winogradskyella sp.]|uniref:M28 family peptidase n=1 Tax=Winogradskyella sp. TaxID=1883156 RepID=UPI000F3DC4FA|nr:M28 family peptidase [Winogradskyella sp.]RNC88014.1 MAG: M28 family peptidase [Winogradskyella sp.]